MTGRPTRAARWARTFEAARAVVRFARETRPPSSRFDSDGVPIHYTEVGSGTPVVLVHGFAVNGDLNWRLPGVVRSLAGDFRVVCMDLRGHGRSGKPHDPAHYGRNLFGDVVRLLDHLGIDRAFVAGYSLGGFAALKLATVAPERLLGVAVLGAGWEQPGNSALLAALPALADALESGRGVGPISGHLGAERRRPGWAHRAWVKLLTRYFNDQRALIGVIRSIPDLEVTRDELQAIAVPVCSIVGSRDPLCESAEAMIGQVRDHAVTFVDGADHIQAPMRRELHEALRSFLSARRATQIQ